MIGVIAKPGQFAIVEEFFQLFKTPWEFYREGRSYDIVIATREIAKVNARLLLLYGDAANNRFTEARVLSSSPVYPYVDFQGNRVPIYQDLLTFEKNADAIVCLSAGTKIVGLRHRSVSRHVLHLGYDLFQEVEHLLTEGQPPEYAAIPTLELHIEMLRKWILQAGLSFLEIPPVPAGHPFFACLTHDIDFVGIRYHKLDHTMWGFLYRATIGACNRWLKGNISLGRLLRCWLAALSLPLVYIGWAKDFWAPFGWYLAIEKDVKSTYFLIPFKGRAGEKIEAGHQKRAAAYDIEDILVWTAELCQKGYEIGVHGIDSWHSVEKGHEELERIAAVTGESRIGIRMHWLLSDKDTARILEEAGYAFDSSSGYNDAIGYRCGTTQAFCPPGARRLLELPIHIQDGALFFPDRLGLADAEAWRLCEALFDHSMRHGGVLTIIWHDRSPHPERFWGDFYSRLLCELKHQKAWFGTASQIVDWFRKRRELCFNSIEDGNDISGLILCNDGGKIDPPVVLRIHRSVPVYKGCGDQGVDTHLLTDIPYTGQEKLVLNHSLELITSLDEK